MAELMAGRKVLVTGARNKWSIAWHSALSMHRAGASLAFSVLGDRERDGVAKLCDEHAITAPIISCDVGSDADLTALAEQASSHFAGSLDGVLHSIAFANREDLAGEFAATSRAGFALANDVSAYSLVALTRALRPMLAAAGGSVVTLSYLGSERVVANYNVMGVAKAALEASVRYLAADVGKENIRVNAVSAGPIPTLAARGISGFDAVLDKVAATSPLRRGITAEEVGDTVMFLMSHLARGITGEVIYVDAGFNIMGIA